MRPLKTTFKLCAGTIVASALLTETTVLDDRTPEQNAPVITTTKEPIKIKTPPELTTAPKHTNEHAKPDSTRFLTSNEKELLTAIFGSSIDTTHIQILNYNQTHDKPELSGVQPYDALHIEVYGTKNHVLDYTKTNDRNLASRFLFEAMRLTQHQNHMRWNSKESNKGAYSLRLRLNRYLPDFSSFSRQQQAQMIYDYSYNVLYKPDGLSIACTPEKHQTLAQTVEHEFNTLKDYRYKKSNQKARGLTENEKSFAKAIFGDLINKDIIKIHLDNNDCGRTAASVANEKDITFWGSENLDHNYFTTQRQFNFGAYIHEITHIWQFQTKFSQTNANFSPVYTYPLNLKKWSFKDYGVEQQAAIIQDYSLLFLHPSKYNQKGYTEIEKQTLQTLVETQFPQAQKSRLYVEKYGRLPFDNRPVTPPLKLRR